MLLLFENNALGTLAEALDVPDTQITLAAGQGARFPQPAPALSYFVLTIGIYPATEIVQVTDRVVDVLTVVRAQEGTSAQAWDSGVIVQNLVTKGTLQAFPQAQYPINVPAPIVSNVLTIDLSLYNGALFYTTVDANFSYNIILPADPTVEPYFIHQTIGNGTVFTGDFSFARWPGGATPIQNSANGIVDTFGYLYRGEWFGYPSQGA